MARKYQRSSPSGHTILVVDDSPDILESTRRLLEAEGHRVLVAAEGRVALELLERESVHLILVDYFMPGMTGEDVVRKVRERDRLVQIILVTGYAGEKPARVMMRQLDIQGYHDKSEGAERLLLWVDAALKTYQHVLAMEKHRTGLRFILEITPEMHRMQPLDELLQGLLWQIEGLLGAENSFLATFSTEEINAVAEEEVEGFVAVIEGAGFRDTSLEIRFGTGRFSAGIDLDQLPDPDRGLVREALRKGHVEVQGSTSVVPLRLGSRPVGVIYIDRRMEYQRDRELLELFANQAAAAIQNALLCELATTDATTGTHLRGFLLQRLSQTVKAALRRGDPLSLLMIDLDEFKEINDRFGHHVGDDALAAVGTYLRLGVRETDVVGRYGGDEFLVILPETPGEGARVVAERLLGGGASLAVTAEGEATPIRMSIGIGTLEAPGEGLPQGPIGSPAFEAVSNELLACADHALYSAKRSGVPGQLDPLRWQNVNIGRSSPDPAEALEATS
jgi:two-component system, cell cycle response regulator